jgi:hypothetical protein
MDFELSPVAPGFSGSAALKSAANTSALSYPWMFMVKFYGGSLYTTFTPQNQIALLLEWPTGENLSPRRAPTPRWVCKKPPCFVRSVFSQFGWCPGKDLNLHALRHWLLGPACLPIPPPGHSSKILKLPAPIFKSLFFAPHPRTAWTAPLQTALLALSLASDKARGFTPEHDQMLRSQWTFDKAQLIVAALFCYNPANVKNKI